MVPADDNADGIDGVTVSKIVTQIHECTSKGLTAVPYSRVQ